jgi:glycerophosphoryl diester phosphodiesterase
MKVIIAGSREIADFVAVETALLKSEYKATEIVSGGARGVDKVGEEVATKHGIPIKVFKADWNKFGRAAGPIRNKQMAEYADALIAVWDGESKGTANMILQAREFGLKIFIYLMREEDGTQYGYS